MLLFVTSMGFDLSCYDIFGTLAAGGKILAGNSSCHAACGFRLLVLSG